MWVATAVAAVGTVISVAGQAETSRIQGAASRRQADANTAQSKAKQAELNAQSELARQIQKINNDRVMRGADKAYTAAATNLTRNRAATQQSNVLRQMADAEAAGAYTAHTASKGVGGSSVEAIESTMRMRDALKEQLTTKAQGQADYDAVQTLAGIIPAGWQQQDMTVISGNQSAAASVPRVEQGYNYGAAIMQFGGLLANMTSGGGKTGNSGQGLSSSSLGLKPGTGDVGFGALKTPDWWSFKSTSRL